MQHFSWGRDVDETFQEFCRMGNRLRKARRPRAAWSGWRLAPEPPSPAIQALCDQPMDVQRERDEARQQLATILARFRTTGHEPPFDGLPCPMCDGRIRNLAATAHNLVIRWERWQQGGDQTIWYKIVDKMRDLRTAVDAVEPLSEAHFDDQCHSHPEGA